MLLMLLLMLLHQIVLLLHQFLCSRNVVVLRVPLVLRFDLLPLQRRLLHARCRCPYHCC